jgi:hypothetical protein
MKKLVFLALLIGVSSYAQGPVRSVDTISNLVNTVNPAASAQGDTVIYAVRGYHTDNDFGVDRFFTASTTAGTTNLAHTLRSAKNPSYYWQSLDANSPTQDPRWFGAYANSTNNSVTNIQAALDYSDPHARRLWLPGGTYFTIDKPIKFDTGMSGGNDYMSVELIGNGAKLVQTSETNIIQLEAQSIFYGKIEDTVFTYSSVVSNINANVISLRGDPTGPNYYNVYNVSFNNLTFLRGYYAIKQEEWCSPWGNKYTQWFVSQELTGGAVDFAPASNFGNVNNVFESIYCRADVMAGPVFKIKNQNLLAMRDIEINILHDKQAMLLTASSSVDIRNWRMEVGSFNNSYDGLFQLANVTQLTWDNLQIQSFDLDAPAGTWNYIIRDVGSGPALNISSLQFNNLYLKNITKTNAASYLAFIYSPYQRYTLQTWDSDVTLANTYAAYPFGAPGTNVTAQPWHRNITDLPTLPGEIAFDTNNWPYIATGIGSTTNWLRLGNSDVFGPAAATDNAVVRFDGTTGKRLKNSGVLIDNSDNLTVPGTILDLGSGSGNPIVSIKGAAGGVRATRFYSGSTSAGLRWNVGANSTAESGSNAGSDYEWNAYNDSGVFLITPFSIERANGKIKTYGKIAYGALVTADSPSIAHYTGSPEGLDTDNPGSLRLDKNGNVWLKASGTGNTGWRQMGMTTVANGSTLITNIAQGTGIQITTSGQTATIGISNTAVSPGTYNYSTITVDQQGRITSASSGSVTPYTSFWPDLTNTVKAGANVSISNDTATSKMYISAIAPTASTNGTPVSVNASPILTYANFQSTVGILVNASGTNVTLTIADRDFGDITVTDSGETFVIDNGVIDTNKITAGFYAWVESQSGSAYTFSTGLTNSGGTVTASLAAGTGIVFATNAQTITISAPYTNIVVSVNGGAAMPVVNFQDNSQITFSQTGSNITASINTSNDGIANLLLVTDTETTDTNQDTTWRDVTTSARSGMSATISAGDLTSGTLLKIEVIGELVMNDTSDWQPDFKIVFDGPTGTDYEVVYTTAEPGSSNGSDGVTWKIECFLTVRVAGNPATLIQRSQWACSDGAGNDFGNDSGYLIAVPGRASNSLNTSADNTVKLYYRANNANVNTMKVSSLVVWKL